MFGKQLEHEIVEHALRAGLDFASVTHGQSGFAFGAKRVSAVGPETAGEGLPICIELLGDREDVARFIDEHSALLAGATVVLFDGVRISTVGED
jgi:PII-like signaling protein